MSAKGSDVTDDNNVVCLSDVEKEARRVLPKHAFDYFRSGSEDEVTLQENLNAYRR
jgi:(S)-2-hydroxy-acid oxidase